MIAVMKTVFLLSAARRSRIKVWRVKEGVMPRGGVVGVESLVLLLHVFSVRGGGSWGCVYAFCLPDVYSIFGRWEREG